MFSFTKKLIILLYLSGVYAWGLRLKEKHAGELGGGRRRKNLQESLRVLCITLRLFLDLRLGRCLSLVGVGGVAGGAEPGAAGWDGQRSAPAGSC